MERREILERLNSYETSVGEDDRGREETLRRGLEMEKHRRPHPEACDGGARRSFLLVLLQAFEGFRGGAA